MKHPHAFVDPENKNLFYLQASIMKSIQKILKNSSRCDVKGFNKIHRRREYKTIKTWNHTSSLNSQLQSISLYCTLLCSALSQRRFHDLWPLLILVQINSERVQVWNKNTELHKRRYVIPPVGWTLVHVVTWKLRSNGLTVSLKFHNQEMGDFQIRLCSGFISHQKIPH